MGTRRLIVQVVGDNRSLERTFASSTRSTAQFGNEMTRTAGRVDAAFTRVQKVAAGGFLGGIAAAATIRGVRQATDAASDLNEQITKSQRVFGDSAQAVLDWSETTAGAIGVSQEQALEAAGTFGNLFSSIRLGADRSADESRRLVQLAADLASFNNADPSEVLLAIRSGLVGEAEPLRRYGVLLSEARVQQVALAETGKDSVTELTNQEKALARIAIIFRDTGKAQGDFARTSGSLANQQRILSAEAKDLEANLGKLLLPGVEKLTSALVDTTGAASDVVDGLRAIGEVEIPAISIPFAFDIGGDGELGDFFQNVLRGAAENAPNLGPLVRGLEILAASRMDAEVEGATPRLAAEFREALGGFFQGALDQALAGLPPPSVDPSKVKGFGTGATPGDILGPLITDIPKRLQEALLDVEIADPENARAMLRVLEQQRNGILEALDDPRLTRDQRIALKQKLVSIESAIAAQNAAIQAAVEAAKQKRLDAVEKAAKDAEDAKQKIAEGFARTIDALQLDVDRAGLTDRLNDDLAALRALEAGLERQIAAGVDVSAAQSQLVNVVGQIADKQEEIRQRALEAVQARQFRALGLSATGEAIVPGVENLQRQLRQLTERLADSGEELPSKLTQQLEGARKILAGKLGEVTKDSRDRINQLFRTIRQTFEEGSRNAIPDRRTVQLSDRILAALGFGNDPDVVRLQRSASTLAQSSGAVLRAPQLGTATTAALPPLHVHLNVDGREIGDVFIRDLQKRAGQTSGTARGRFPGRSLGLG